MSHPHAIPEKTPIRRTALITGASAGIGECFARAYAAKGCDLVLIARREERLLSLAADLKAKHDTESSVICADLSKPGAVDESIAFLAKDRLHIDILVNNAGYGLPGTYDRTEWSDQQAFLQLMFHSPAELCHKLLSPMRDNDYGRIINVSSLAGLVPGSTGHTLYSAVKSGLIKFSESLNAENRDHGVNVSALCPGMTYSEFHDVNGQRDRVSQLPAYMWKSAEEVVQTGMKAVEANRAVCVPGLVNKSIAAFAHALPGSCARALMRGQSSKFRKAES